MTQERTIIPDQPRPAYQNTDKSISKGIILGAIAGSMGALVWAGIVYFLHYELGWIAWGIGFIVALGVVMGNGANTTSAICAVLITVASISGGKYLSAELIVTKDLKNNTTYEEYLPDLSNEESIISYVADDIIEEKVEQGESIEWPEGIDSDLTEKKADYPPVIWAEAEASWFNLPDSSKEKYISNLETTSLENIKAYFNMIKSDLRMSIFKDSFGIMDILFFILAIITAFRIARTEKKTEVEKV